MENNCTISPSDADALTNSCAASIMASTKQKGDMMMAVIREPFGRTKDGREVEKLTLRRGALEAEVLT